MKKQLLFVTLCIFGTSIALTAQERTRNAQPTSVVQKENPFTQIQQTAEYKGVVNDQDIPTRDQVILDDLIVDGSICVGFDCVNGEIFGFDTVRLKENNLRIGFVDTSNSGSFPTTDWEITINDSADGGASYFGITDRDTGRRIFTLEANAPTNALVLEDDGDVGFGTANPVVDLHAVDGNTPTLRLDQDGSNGFTPHVWDIAGNESNFFVRDATNGSTLPFRIFPGSSNNALVIRGNAIGVGGNNSSVNANASIDLRSATEGLLLNRMTNTERDTFDDALVATDKGILVYDTDDNQLYSWDGTQWQSGGADTDDQTVDVFQLTAANVLELSLDNDGVATQTVDLSSLDDSGTDDQAISFAGTTLTLEDGGTADLSSLDDSGTDDQNISGSGLSGTTLTIGIEGGTSQTVDLSSLNDSGTDDQSLTLTGNTLALEDGGNVDLSFYLDNTDNQILSNFILTGDVLGITLQNGGTTQVDIGSLVDPLRDDLEDAQNQLATLSAQMGDVLARLEAIEDCACDGTLGVTNFNLQPNQPVLLQNIPNPFDNSTSIGYFIPFRYNNANIIVSATSGRLLENYKIDRMGEGEILVNKERMQSAVYFYTLYVDGKRIDTKRMVVE
jgi:hypothetical protein